MGKIYNIFDKFSIISIALGLLMGIYLAIHHDDANLWIRLIPFILLFSLIITIIPIGSAIYDRIRNGVKFPISELIEAFLLNVAIIAVCTAFGVVIGSFLIGNVILDNGKLPALFNFK